MTDKQQIPPPHDLNAERSILGCCLLDRAALITVLSLVRVDDFFHPPHAIIYSAIESIWDENRIPDYVTLTNRIMQDGVLEAIGGGEYIAGLTNVVPTVRNAEHYCEIVKNAAGYRRLHRLGNELSKLALAPRTMKLKDLQNKVLNDLMVIGQGRSTEKAFNIYETYLESDKYARDVLDGVKLPPIKTGFANLDKKVSLVPGEYAVLGGYTSTGKTSLAVNIAKNVAWVGGKVLFISFEMTQRMMDHKFASVISGYPGHLFKYGRFYHDEKYKEALREYAENVKNLRNRLWIKHMPGASDKDVHRVVRQEMLEHPGIELVIIDYLQKVQVESRRYTGDTERITKVSDSMATLAGQSDAALLVCSQLRRADNRDPDKPPMLADLRGSGAIEQDAGIVFLINLKEKQKDGRHYDLDYWNIELVISKGRTDGTGLTDMYLERKTGIFREGLYNPTNETEDEL